MLIIGLDGATWDIIKPHVQELPTFKKLLEQFDSYTIHLKQKPWSASVWCSMFSGKTPEEHQHLNFVKNDKILTRSDISVEFAWDKLSKQEKNVIALNVPFIVPPFNFNIDFEPPGHGVPISQGELNAEIEMITTTATDAILQRKPDLFIAVYTALDKMSHLHWGEQALIDYYKKIDTAIAAYLDLDDSILFLSDHGFTDYDKAPIQSLPKITSTGNKLKGDHHPDAIAIAKNIPFKVNQPMDVYHGIINYFK